MSTLHKTLYLVRHGETHSNVKGIFQGESEPLTRRGRGQASRLAKRLRRERKRYPITLLLTSSHVRAMETATPIANALGLTPKKSDLFVERKHPSIIHGKPTSDSDAKAVWMKGRMNFHNPDFDYEDGETFTMLKSRALSALEFIERNCDTHIAVVTHGVFATALVAASQRKEALASHDLNQYQFRMDNTGLSIITHETHADFSHTVTGWIIRRWNDTSHLD